ncbi:hypothetical protein [Streptomyces sp. 4F14]|uniref:hypothetical protein n=1 Tax=Streptomyces sp. 4F14 TaxID=3394380 RepID=UPI003A8380B7
MTALDEQYEHGLQGALFTVETSEDAWRLGALEGFLGPRIRERLAAYRRLIDSCDNRVQLAHDALALSRAAADYSDLREALFLDSTQHGDEPPWRVWDSVALRIRPRLYRCDRAALILAPGRHEVPAWGRAWHFTVVRDPHDPQDHGSGHPVTLYRTHEHTDAARDTHLVDAPPELEEHGEWYRQLFYGFRALKLRVSLGAITHEDVKRRVIDGTATADRHPES